MQRLATHLWAIGTYGERYVPGGYYDDMALDEKLDIISQIEGLDGLAVFYPTNPLPADPEKLLKKLADFGLQPNVVGPENFTDRKWRHGALSTNEKHIRQANITLCKEAIDFAAAISVPAVLVWPAHDGFDYPFQTDYEDGWKYLVDSYREICAHNPKIKIQVEFKQKDPRQRQYVSNIGRAMMLFNDVGADNLVGALDTGHALMSSENLAEDVVIYATHGKLDEIHLNENYRDADPDMLFGTLVFWDNLEMYYYLKKYNFSGWQLIDIICPRDDRVKALKLVVKLAKKYNEMAERLWEKREVLEENLKGYRFADNMELITDLVFK
jgi:sugar phosphate isomerase/epimerase